MGGVVDSLGGFLGLSSGPDAPATQTANAGLSQANSQNSLYLQPGLMQRLAEYGAGTGGTAQNALNNYANELGLDGSQKTELANAMATNPLSGSRMANEQVMNSPILGQLFGKGGQLEQASGRVTDLANRGYSLQPEDNEAYGQASGNIARMFGAQEQGLGQSLANRGLAQGGSGAAYAGFAGLQGNKNEQLANSQRQIADNRMQMNQKRLVDAQNYTSQLGGQADQAITNQYNRQLAGAKQQRGGLNDVMGAANQQNNEVNRTNMANAEFQIKNKPANFQDYINGGLGSGLYKVSEAGGGGTAANAANSAGGAAGGGMFDGGMVGGYGSGDPSSDPEASKSNVELALQQASAKDDKGGGGGGGGMMSMLPMLAMLASKGGKVPGEATVEGDSKHNDTVPTMLSPGEVVLPRTVVKKGPQEAAKFTAKAKKGGK